MEFEKIEGRRKGSSVFSSDGFIYVKNNEYKGRINLRCHLHKRNCCGTASIDNGKLFNNQPHNHPKNFEEIERIKIEAKMKNDCEVTSLAPRDIYNINVNTKNLEMTPFAKLASTMRKRRATSFMPVRRKAAGIDNELNVSELERVDDDDVIFKSYTNALEDLAPICMSGVDLSSPECMRSIHAYATFNLLLFLVLKFLTPGDNILYEFGRGEDSPN